MRKTQRAAQGVRLDTRGGWQVQEAVRRNLIAGEREVFRRKQVSRIHRKQVSRVRRMRCPRRLAADACA
jgi:hypothetical protein